MNACVIWLITTSPFHLGEKGIGLEETAQIIHSDTLWSAICNAWVRFYDEEHLKTELIERFKEDASDPPFLISSAFPYAYDVKFFPRPMVRLKNEEIDLKRLKEVKFVSQAIFEKVIKGEKVDSLEKNLLQHGTLWVTEEERNNLLNAFMVKEPEDIYIWKEQEVPRVTLDRKTSASEIFYFSRIVFSGDCGYFFLVKYLDPQLKQKFETVLRFLGDLGIGGDRTTGHGQFKPIFGEDYIFSEPSETDHFLTLSLFFPKESEIKNGLLGEEAAYEFIKRGGWIHSPQAMNLRRKSVRMFAEGSVFCGVPTANYGRVADVTPDREKLPKESKNIHNVYRYGLAFTVGVMVR